MRMKDKVALITGAASGMGAATARMFGREGAAMVFVADILDKEGADVVDSIKKREAGRATCISTSPTRAMAGGGRRDREERRRPRRAGQQCRHLGLGRAGSYDTAAWNRLMGINATGVFLGMKHGIPAMKKRGKGSVINLSSVSGHRRPGLHPCRLQRLQGRGAA
jgi:NAD(P)-dependent dehydrogenase (short-subunit alcohol dehydrogenase family)